MAKRAKTESVLSRETRLKAEADAIAAAKAAEEKAAAEAKEAIEKRRAIENAPKAPRPKKVKKPRFVREQTEKKPAPKPPTRIADRSTTRGGKIMTKNLAYVPPEETASGPQPKGFGRP